MSTTNVNFKLDTAVKKGMEEACAELGLSMSAAFTIFARKLAREKRIPFEVSVDPAYVGVFDDKAYALAKQNTRYNEEGSAVISKDDEWVEETEWDDLYNKMKEERSIDEN